MSKILFHGINFHLIGAIDYFNKYNKKSSGGNCPQYTLLRYVPMNTGENKNDKAHSWARVRSSMD